MQKLVKVKAVKNFVIDGYEEYPFQRMGHAHPFEYVEVPETRVERLLNDGVIELLPEVIPDVPVMPVANKYAGIVTYSEPKVEPEVVPEPTPEEIPEPEEDAEDVDGETEKEKTVRKTTRRKSKAKK